ncbi:hypothetical protein [Thalassospira marina]|uniref:hypothetical protein n=1 Tax=Thalassospira marina TaxID=2048283 RepID=UPI001054DC55|nr:hypothetical protein [Thalassospira marina]
MARKPAAIKNREIPMPGNHGLGWVLCPGCRGASQYEIACFNPAWAMPTSYLTFALWMLSMIGNWLNFAALIRFSGGILRSTDLNGQKKVYGAGRKNGRIP